jgi:hypothetical protein
VAGTAISITTASVASAAPGPRTPACNSNVLSRDVPDGWIPRSSGDQNKRFSWNQVSQWDKDRNNRLDDQELTTFRNAGQRITGGPNCSRPDR